MARIAPSDVRGIVDTDLSDTKIQNWIDIATVIVDQIEDQGVTDADLLEKIELLWTAHLITSNHSGSRRKSSIQHESASVTFESGEDTMDFGTMAQLLDPTGTLSDDDKEQANLRTADSRGLDDKDDDLTHWRV